MHTANIALGVRSETRARLGFNYTAVQQRHG